MEEYISLKLEEISLGALEGASRLLSFTERRGSDKLTFNWINSMLGRRYITSSLREERVAFRPARGCQQDQSDRR